MDLLERLRSATDGWSGDAFAVDQATAEDAAAEIERIGALWIAETRENEHLRAALADMIDFGEHASPYALSTNSKQRIASAKVLLNQQTGSDR